MRGNPTVTGIVRAHSRGSLQTVWNGAEEESICWQRDSFSWRLRGGSPGGHPSDSAERLAAVDSTDHFCPRVKTISAPSAGHPQSMLEAYHQMVINAERNVAKGLGNLERLEKWQQTQFFAVAREEWFRACTLFAKRHGIAAVLKLRAGEQENSGDAKAAALALLRLGAKPSETLQRHAPTIYRAACDGDVDFFHKIGLALRSRNQKKIESGSTGYALLTHWFSGLLWLMNDEAGHRALRSYTKNRIDIWAYRQMLRRLRLRNHPGRAKPPPVLAYHSKTKSYVYSQSWTSMESTLSS